MIKLIVFCYEDYRRNAGLSFHVLVPKAHSNEFGKLARMDILNLKIRFYSLIS